MQTVSALQLPANKLTERFDKRECVPHSIGRRAAFNRRLTYIRSVHNDDNSSTEKKRGWRQHTSTTQSLWKQAHALAIVASINTDWLSRAAIADTQPVLERYKPAAYQPSWQVWVGAIAAAIPFLIGSWEFGKRILIQQRCGACKGSGLIQRGRFLRKCPECGGFFPWQGWKQFFTSTATPGNGGVLRAPRGQTGIFYRVPEKSPGESTAGRGSAGPELPGSDKPSDGSS